MSDTTHEAPKRIWIQTDHIPDQCALDKWHVQPDANEASLFTDYVRADIHATRIEKLEAKLAKVVEERDEALNQLDSARHSIDVLLKRAKTFCDGWGVADKGRIEAEAKLVKAKNFLDYLDENYRHVFGDTARQKIRELYAELKGKADE